MLFSARFVLSRIFLPAERKCESVKKKLQVK